MEGLDGPGAPGRSGLPGVRRGERRDRGRQAEGAGGALQPEAEGDRGAEQGDLPSPGRPREQLRPLPVPVTPPPPVRSVVRGEQTIQPAKPHECSWNSSSGFLSSESSAIFARRQIVEGGFFLTDYGVQCNLHFSSTIYTRSRMGTQL